MKSWLVLDLAVCASLGLPWLGFDTSASPLYFLNLEVPRWHFQQRLEAIVKARAVTLKSGMLRSWSLRGVDVGSDRIWNLVVETIETEGRWGLVLVDPLYKLYSASRDESSTSASGEIMKRFDRLTEATGAASLFTHHYTKGSPNQKEAQDRFSGSGVLIRDPDTYIAMTRHKEENCFTLDFTMRCLPPIESFVIRWNHPLFERVPDLDPKELRPPPDKKKTKYSAWDLVEQLGNDDLKTTEFCKRCEEETGMSSRTFYDLLKEAQKQNLLSKSKVDQTWEVVRRK
jgi:RecA-family ATPase